MATRAPSDWLEELGVFLNDAITVHSLAVMGVWSARERLAGLPRAPDSPDPAMYFGIGDPNDPDAQFYGYQRVADLPAYLADDGPAMIQAGHQWIVHVYARWEHYFRPGLASAFGCDVNDLRASLLGDLRRLRHDVVHHGGIATAEHTGACEVLDHWFRLGDTILVGGKEIAEFVRRFPWDELRAGPSSER